MKNLLNSLLLALVLAALGGCGIGHNNVLFVTKTNGGIDIDTTPPTAEFAISRTEGVVAPTFEEGKTLPVMASVRSTSSGLFAGGISQTFATGDAATTMARLFGDENPCPGAGSLEECYGKPASAGLTSTLNLKTDPKIKDGMKPRPVFFGTSTTIGVRVGWSAMSSAMPDSLNVGYRRKELAMAPVMQKTQGTTFDVSLPSLLGTIGFDGEVSSPQETKGTWTQYFATGRSASAMALKKEVRQAMLSKMNPAYQPYFGEVRPVKVGLLMDICRELQQRATTDSTAQSFYFRTNAAMTPIAVSKYGFNKAVLDGGGGNVTLDQTKDQGFPEGPDPCIRALQYRSELADSVQTLSMAVHPDYKGTVNGGEVTKDVITALIVERDAQLALLHDLDRRMKEEPVIDEVFYYWLKL